MSALSQLEQLAVDAFAAALETCREENIELLPEIQAIEPELEKHVSDLSNIAKAQPQFHTFYRNARNALRRASATRSKRATPATASPSLVQEAPNTWKREHQEMLNAPEKPKNSPQANTDPTIVLERADSSPNSSTQLTKEAAEQPHPPIIYRYTLPRDSNPQAIAAFPKQVESIRQQNPDWVVSFDIPNANEADAIFLIHKDENYPKIHATYLASRTLNRVVAPALSRIFN